MPETATGTATAADALVILFQALPNDAQVDAFERISELHVARQARDTSEAARMLRSLLRVAEVLSHHPSIDEYKAVSQELIAAGEDIETFSRLYSFYGSWRLAREALDLSAVTTPRRIEARFRSRRVGKVWRYTDDELRAAVEQAEAYWQRLPTVAEFDWWRERQLELAKANGDELHLPSATPYRKRWGTWEGALLHFGYSPEQVADRLGASGTTTKPGEEPFVPDDAAIAELELREAVDHDVLSREQMTSLVGAYERLPRRSRHVLTARLGLATDEAPLREVSRTLGLTPSRVAQLQTLALTVLSEAVTNGDRRAALAARGTVVSALQRLAVRLAGEPR